MAERVEVVIIGSGYGGTIPAARLAQAGMKVVVLERGARLGARDFAQSDDPKQLLRVLDLVVSSDNIAYRTGKLVGGASINMDGGHFRMPQQSFEVRDQAGRPYWPAGFSRATLDPYYERSEAMLRVRQMNWHEIPRAGGLFGKMLDAAGASCERARMNYTDCLHCGFCSQGCRFDKKMTLLHTYLPVAEAAGAEVRPGCQVDTLTPEGTGYLVRYRAGGEAREIWGQRVVLGAGGIHSPALLLRSAAALPGLSRHVGENFNNNGEHAFIGILPPGFDDLERYHCYRGMDNAGLMSFHWFASDGISIHPGGGLEPTVLAATLEHATDPVLPRRAWGMQYKRFVEAVYPHRLIAFSVLGLAEGHRAVVDRGGGADLVPRDRTAFDGYLDRVDRVMAEVATRSGVTLTPVVPRRLAGMTSAHLLSTCRIAERAEDGVVSPDGQVFGHDNLWMCDASTVPFALGVNPALTISALAERTSEKILARG